MSFNPRSRKGNDLVGQRGDRRGSSVSIHVPARGTTPPWPPGYPQIWRFQSTFPQGERPDTISQHRAGGNVSIHVPARGTTQLQQLRQHLVNSFNPRSRKGNDRGALRSLGQNRCFNPRSRKGNDHIIR